MTDDQMSSPPLWRVLKNQSFRGLVVTGGFFFIGNAMQNTAASWLMLERSGSSALTALVQTASFLPMFLLSLPAGVLADTIDRRKMMLAVQAVYAFTALLLALTDAAGVLGSATLLFFTFILGCCTAWQSPAWHSVVSEAVRRDELLSAITLISMAYNVARVVGPALAGAILVWVGSSSVFAITLLCAVGMSYATWRWPPKPVSHGRLPVERLWGGMLNALRYARHSPLVCAQLIRTVAFSAIGSALWALLPVLAQKRMGLGAAGYGTLMACLGAGAVGAGLLVGAIRSRFSIDTLGAVCSVVFGVAMATAAFSPWRLPVYLILIAGGAAWMTMMATLNAATQTSVPTWLRARAISLHNLCSLGSFALGSAVWGGLTSLLGSSVVLGIAAFTMILSTRLTRRFPIRMGDETEMTLAFQSDEMHLAHEPEFEAGPVAVEVIYRIRQGEDVRFLAAAHSLAVSRRRQGATFWRIYRDLSETDRFVERFIVTSWADYLRQRERVTVASRHLEAQARSFQNPGEPVVIHHYVAQGPA